MTIGLKVRNIQQPTTNYHNKYNKIVHSFDCGLLPFLVIICQQVRRECATESSNQVDAIRHALPVYQYYLKRSTPTAK